MIQQLLLMRKVTMGPVSKLFTFKCLMLTFLLCWQTQGVAHEALTSSNTKLNHAVVKNIQIQTVKLTDNSGLTYIGGKVNTADLSLYLSQMKQILGNDFALYRQHQSARDHHTFHMTLVNPYEYQSLQKDVIIGTTLSVSLHGLGRVEADEKATYFVVAQSLQAQNYRQQLVLPMKDFHITLGFNPSDIYGVNKGIASLINQQ
jgi:hypothetical protein